MTRKISRSSNRKGITGEKEILILQILQNLDSPIGSGNLTEIIEDQGINISQASIGRILNSLEWKGYLTKDRNKGRIITPSGKNAMREALERNHVNNLRSELDNMLGSKTLKTFIMILETRRIIESATVKLAAKNITEEELSRLKELLEVREAHIKKEESISSLDIEFHSLIASASRNEILSQIYLIISRLGQQSELFEYMRKKASGSYLRNHREIYEALCEHDSRKAEKSLIKHMDALIHDVKKYWQEHPDPA